MTKTILQSIKTSFLNGINAIPVTSATLGSPRKALAAAAIDFTKQGNGQYLTIIKANPVTEVWPGTIDQEVFFKYNDFYQRTQPEQFILKLNGGRAWGRTGAVITDDDIFITDVSKEFGAAKFDVSKHSIFRKIKLKKPIQFHGTLAVIASPGPAVYAHWFCDIIPRLILLKNAGLLHTIDAFLLNYTRLDFQVETLVKLGIDESKIINCADDPDFHIRATTLYVPSYPNEHGTVNKWVCQEIRKIFIPQGYESKKTGRLFITRAKAIGRKMTNEEEVFSFLQKEYGFTKIYAEDYSTSDKAKLFNDAECIIGPHGGGFTNLIFCAQGCKVVDIFPPGDFTTYFWTLANSNELEYYYFFGRGELPTRENNIAERNADIDVDIDKFKRLMQRLNLKK